MVAGGSPSNNVTWVQGSLFKNQLGNLGPSFGFAWDPFGTGKTSVRANYRIAYDRINDLRDRLADSAQPARLPPTRPSTPRSARAADGSPTCRR